MEALAGDGSDPHLPQLLGEPCLHQSLCSPQQSSEQAALHLRMVKLETGRAEIPSPRNPDQSIQTELFLPPFAALAARRSVLLGNGELAALALHDAPCRHL